MHCHKILVVEDDDSIRATLVNLLALEGYEAVPAHHGKEALKLLPERREDPCLVITDLMMPEMDGWELIDCLNEKDALITVPVVVMTAAMIDRVHDKQIVKKPFNLEAVIALVREHCGPPEDGPITLDQTAL